MDSTPAYDTANPDVLGLVPQDARRIVDVGCMLGSLAREIRRRIPQVHITGIDINPLYTQVAAEHCSQTLACDIETLDADDWDRLFPSDCWILADCLEHLRDPWAVLRRLRQHIQPDGCLLTCVPNVQNWTVLWRLLSGHFRYEKDGMMDRTHLRWFTRTTMMEMFEETGWQPVDGMTRTMPPQKHEAAFLKALYEFAGAVKLDPQAVVNDATPWQYVVKCVPA